jgi:hypothetical protein
MGGLRSRVVVDGSIGERSEWIEVRMRQHGAMHAKRI